MSFHSPIEAPRPTKKTTQATQATRGAKRARVLMSGTLLTPTGTQKVTIRDISRSGAQLATTEKIPSDCDAIFKRGSLFAAARVAWSSSDEAGIRFYRELSPEEIDGTLPSSLLRNPR
jgi:PilZ domain